MPELGFAAEPIAAPSNAYTHCKEQHSAKALHLNSRQPGAETLFSSLQQRKALSEMPTTVAGSLTMEAADNFATPLLQ